MRALKGGKPEPTGSPLTLGTNLGLKSLNPELQVRKARNVHECFCANKWWRSPLCSRRIGKGQTYVAKVELGYIRGKRQWLGDLRHYCVHCALKVFSEIRVTGERVA